MDYRIFRALPWIALCLVAGCSCETPPSSDTGVDANVIDTASPLDAPPLDAPLLDAPGDVSALDSPSVLDAPIVASDAPGVSVAVSSFMAYGNCKPLVPPDSILASWTVDISGASASTARFVSGTLTFTTGLVVDVEVETPDITLTGGAASAAQRRAPGTAAVDGCGTLCGSSPGVTLDAVYEIGGATFLVRAVGNYSCAF
jgi:hypothetical protein